MKTKFLLPLAALFFATTTVSCDSCNKKTAADDTTVNYADTTTVAADTPIDTTIVADGQASEPSPANAPSGTKRKAKSADTESNGSSVGGYSAPDGTDAENNDGDQYTRNDQKPQPSGPPIK